MNDRIQEIKGRHEAATQGSWNYFETDDEQLIIYDDTYFNRHIATIMKDGVESREREKANADLIVYAREDVSYLLSEVERLQTELEFWKQAAETQKHNNLAILKEHRAMKEALEWYGDYEGNYDPEIIDKLGYLPIDIDGGEKARTALSHLKG